MPLITKTITHTLFGQDGVEFGNAEVLVTLSDDEIDLTLKHIRVNETPILKFTADSSGVALLVLPINIINSFYTVKTFTSGTTDFINSIPLHTVKIRVGDTDSDLVDIIV